MSASIPLPTELSNHILQSVAGKEKDKDDFTLGDFSLCSPCNAISWAWITSPQKQASGNPSIHLLLRKLLESPPLCASIKNLSFNGDPGTTEQINGRDVKVVENLVHGAQFPLAPLWIDALNLGNINVFVVLVLLQLHNLQTLHLDQDFFANS